MKFAAHNSAEHHQPNGGGVFDASRDPFTGSAPSVRGFFLLISRVLVLKVSPGPVLLTLTVPGGFDTIRSELSPLVGFSFGPTL